MSEPQKPKSSPEKRQKPERLNKATRLQLNNPSHKLDLLKLFDGVRIFRLLETSTADSIEDSQDRGLSFDGSDDEDSSSLSLQVVPEDGKSNSGAFPAVKIDGAKLVCNTCGIPFEDLTDLRIHCRLDWHRFNVKRKVHGQPPVSEPDFDEMIDELSSIEGSDSENQETPSDSNAAVSRLMDKINLLSSVEEDMTKGAKARQSSETKLQNSPKIYFENSTGKIFGIFKHIAELGVNQQTVAHYNNCRANLDHDFTSDFINVVDRRLNIAVIMASGGHFAAAIFKGSEVVNHKTFHSYTVRAKQGGSQGSSDSKSGTSHAKSAGASLRRYNEQSFAQHVQDLIKSWGPKLAACQVIFYRAVSSNANVLFGGKNPPLQRGDPKLRTVPFPTKRPTFAEVKRVQSLLTVLNIYDDRSQFLSDHMPSNKKIGIPKDKVVANRATSRSPIRHEEPVPPTVSSDQSTDGEDVDIVEVDEEIDFNHLKEFDDSLTPEEREIGRGRRKIKRKKTKPEELPKPSGVFGVLFDALTSNDHESVQLEIATLRTELDILNQKENLAFTKEINQEIDFQQSTFLHLATRNNHLDAVWFLLEYSCDPAAKDKAGKCPYNYADNKECRDTFRRFMGQFPDKFDYRKAQVPTPITVEMEAEKAEKKKMLNKLKREKEKLKKMEKKEKEKEVSEKERFLHLSDREKRALAAEQRILEQCKRNGEKKPVLIRCFDCASDMTGKVPFEYNQNIFCTTKCLAIHRKKFPTPLSVL